MHHQARLDFPTTTCFSSVSHSAHSGRADNQKKVPTIDLHLQNRNRYMLSNEPLVLLNWWNKVQFAGCYLNACDICGCVGNWETHSM